MTRQVGFTSIWGGTFGFITYYLPWSLPKMKQPWTRKEQHRSPWKNMEVDVSNMKIVIFSYNSLPTSESSCGHPIPPSSNLQNSDKDHFVIYRGHRHKSRRCHVFPDMLWLLTPAGSELVWLYIRPYYDVKIRRGECLLTPSGSCTFSVCWLYTIC